MQKLQQFNTHDSRGSLKFQQDLCIVLFVGMCVCLCWCVGLDVFVFWLKVTIIPEILAKNVFKKKNKHQNWTPDEQLLERKSYVFSTYLLHIASNIFNMKLD